MTNPVLPSKPEGAGMRQEPSSPNRRCAHGKLFTESCEGCGYIHPRDMPPKPMTASDGFSDAYYSEGEIYQIMADGERARAAKVGK